MEQSYKERAIAYHHMGYNCAQSVVCAYAEAFDLPDDVAYRLSEGFGLGMGVMQVCGALSGAIFLSGWKNSAGIAEPGKTKGITYKQNREMTKAFTDKNGSMICAELKGVQTGEVLRSCQGCIEDACDLVETYLLQKE